jgi:hypothetical protein
MDWAYTADGLVMGYGKTSTRNQVNIDLFQILIGGAKPKDLKGARDTAIQIIRS